MTSVKLYLPGLLLVLASALALVTANTGFYGLYHGIFHDIYLGKSLLHWINDGLMAIFFLLVGIEIKREVVTGALSTRAGAMLPVLAAIGGMVVPACFYLFLNRDNLAAISGWAIPTATDIAFALGVLALLGTRAPLSLKILLAAIAIIDDLGAILIIAFFYGGALNVNALLFAFLPLTGLYFLNRYGIGRRLPYIILGILLWAAVLKSGVHATMAGVITALFVPLHTDTPHGSPAQKLERTLHPWVAFLILPLFGFANSGVPFDGIGWNSLYEPVTLGIILGLVAGKQLGVFGTLLLAIKSGFCQKPEGTSWPQLYGMSILCGIGFTMSLFIGGLAFSDVEMQASIRLGVLTGSFISAIAAYMILRSNSEKS